MVEIRWKERHIPGVSNPANKPVSPPEGTPVDPEQFKEEVDTESRFHYLRLAGDVFVRIRRSKHLDSGKKQMYSVVRIARKDSYRTKEEFDDVWKGIEGIIPIDEATYGNAGEFTREFKACGKGIQMG
jgi:hypothetical protein